MNSNLEQVMLEKFLTQKMPETDGKPNKDQNEILKVFHNQISYLENVAHQNLKEQNKEVSMIKNEYHTSG
jgi:hypothetical protein